MKQNIGDIVEDFLQDTRILIAPDRIRRYEESGLFSSTRNKSNEYREYSEDEQNRVKKVLMLIEIGVKLEDIQKDDTEAIDRRIKSISYILEKIKKIRKGSD